MPNMGQGRCLAGNLLAILSLMRLNERMKTIALILLGASMTMVLTSCGECACNSYNKDYLRDVPVTRSARFR